MEQFKKLRLFIDQLNLNRSTPFVVDDHALQLEVEKDKLSLLVKILMYFGALIASGFFTGLIFTIINSEDAFGIIMPLGIIYYVISLVIDYNSKTLFVTALSTFGFVMGELMLTYGLYETVKDESMVCFLLILLNTFSIVFMKNYLTIFLASISTGGYLLFLFISVNEPLASLLYILLGIAIIALYYLFENRYLFFFKKNPQKLNAIRDGIIISLLFGFGLSANNFVLKSQTYQWFTTAIISFLFILSIIKVSKVNTVNKLIQCLPVLIIALSTYNAPYILGSFYLVFLGIYGNHRTLLGIGILSVFAGIINFYYNLDLTLLEKSITLIGSGIFFLIIYWIIFHKKLIRWT